MIHKTIWADGILFHSFINYLQKCGLFLVVGYETLLCPLTHAAVILLLLIVLEVCFRITPHFCLPDDHSLD
jgi:hypothetical protein